MSAGPGDGTGAGPGAGADRPPPVSLRRERAFRALLSVQLANAVAVWIHVVSVQWVLTERGESASVISLAPAAMAVPFLVLALPVGVVAGFASRKKMMAWATTMSALAAVAATVLTVTGADDALPMILSVVLVGSALVVVGVSWQSLLPETVDRRVIPAAALVDGAVFNLARSLGPLLAGFGLGFAGAEWAFAAVAVLSVGCALTLWWMERRSPDRTAPRRAIMPEISGAVRFVANSAWTTRLLFQLFLFGVPSSALWALISLAVHDRLGMGADGFGALMALIGAGAVVAVVGFGGLRRRLRVTVFAACGAFVYALALAVLALSTSPVVVAVAMLFAGAAWVSVQSTWMSMGHQFFPDWVRPRLIAFILLMFQGTQAVGSLLWGVVADVAGLQVALLTAAGLMVVSCVSLVVVGLGAETGIEPVLVSELGGPVAVSPAPAAGAAGGGDSGPVVIRYDYRVPEQSRLEFRTAMRGLRRSRLRLGGRDWRLENPAGETGLWVETYLVGSAGEFAEQERERLTVPEIRLRHRVASLAVSVAGPRLHRQALDDEGPTPTRSPRRRNARDN
ncbi:MFS transporter [Rhodococcus sp. IEGM 1408]|uniref:MFS transporter n=1 Tax=Rhodococcus sp. IEGM 1408 TaxID=3082220 RepID=UPI0029536DC9|nr:MFS transporter [Rhodococcus sp. IEGM 1408]MDV8002647.1 MFS transporter [Rhodococcus sp. IEGM 1408]